MKGKAKPVIVGLFVLLAVGVGIGSLLLLGGGYFFEKAVPFVMFFDGSVTGLSVGAPVTFRGVKVGTVSDLRVTVDEHEYPRIPVYIRLRRDAIVPDRAFVNRTDMIDYVHELVADGLRAELRLESFITGQLMVQLDFFPEEPPLLVGGDVSVAEIPTRQTGLEKLTRSVEQLPLDLIIERIINALEGIDTLVNAPEVRSSLTDLGGALKEMRKLLQDMREQVGPVRTELEISARSLRQLLETLNRRVDPLADRLENTADETRALVKNVGDSVERIGPKLEKSAEAAAQAFETAGKSIDLEAGPGAELLNTLMRAAERAESTLRKTTDTLTAVEAGIGEQSPVQAELAATLRELREAARSLRILTDYLQRHPEAFIRGRANPGGPEP